MEKTEINDLKNEVKDYQSQNLEEMFLMTYYSLKEYINAGIHFGFHSDAAKEALKIIRDFFQILKEEKKIMNYLIRKFSLINNSLEIGSLLNELDDLNESTVCYYYSALEKINVACEMMEEWRIARPHKHFTTLIDNNYYQMKACSLTIKRKDIYEFLNYEDDFWQFIEKRILVDQIGSYSDFYGVNLKMNDDKLIDIKVIVPEIVNLETSLINISLLSQAYVCYNNLGNVFPKYELEARNEGIIHENFFQNEVLPKIYKKEFKKEC